MNARAHAIEIRDDSNLNATRRLVAAAMLAILLLNATVMLARADSNNPFPGTQNDFTNQCRTLGGTPHREATHVVSCTWPNGGKQTCDFNQKPNSCTYTPPPKNSPAPGGNATSGTIMQADQVTTTDAGQPGGVLTEGSQVVNADSSASEVAQAEEDPAVSDETTVQIEPGDVTTLPDFEGEGD